MKRPLAVVVSVSLLSIALIGCNERSKSSTTTETEIETPRGTTTITTEKEIKKSGDDPPATP